MKKFISALCSALILISAVTYAGAETAAQKASHDEGFIVKESFEFYEELKEGQWTTGHSEISLSLDKSGAAYGGKGNALRCDYDFTNVADTLSFYKNSFIYNEDSNGNPMGESSRFSFWVRSENAINMRVRFVDGSDYQKYTLTTEYISVPAGESIVTLDWADFVPNNYTVHHDFYAVYQLQFLIKPATSDKTGYLCLDEIGMYPGEPAERMHGSGAVIPALDAANWINKNSNSEISLLSASPRYHNGGNTEALEVKYTSLSAASCPNFYYNGGISAEALSGEDKLLSFWAHSSRPVKLNVTYMDSSLTSGTLVQCGSMEIDLPAGESIVKIPMKALAPAGHEMQFKWAYQLQFSVLPSGGSEGGRLYIDEIGFYATETDTVLCEMLDALKQVSIESAAEAIEIFDYYTSLSAAETADITSYTLARYNALMAKYDSLAPYVSEVISSESSENYARGTLTFITTLENARHAGFTVKEIGAVLFREALLPENTPLTLEVENTLRAGEEIVSIKDKYNINVVLESCDSDAGFTGSGYFGTSYIARPYAVYQKADGTLFTVYGRLTASSRSSEKAAQQANIAKAFDNSSTTAFTAPCAGESSFIYELPEETEFSCIVLKEAASSALITDCVIEVQLKGGAWQTVYSQDEMGTRKALLDKTYTADKVRVTVYSEGIASIEDISFETALKTGNSAKYISYYSAAGYSAAEVAGDAEQLENITDAILFDYGSWNTSGEFNFKASSGGEANLAAVIAAVRSAESYPELWFCLQNYDKAEIAEIVANEGISETAAKNRLLATAASRQKLIDFCVNLCDNYNLTGIDVDYEYPYGSTQWSNYALFIKGLGSALHAKGYKLSLAMSAWGISNFDSSTIAAIDYVNVMSYDGESTEAFGRHSTYAKAVNDINYFKNLGFESRQLVLGLAFYGKPMSGNTEYLSYNALCRRYFNGISRNRNIYGKYYCPGVALTADKTYLALSEGLAGVFSWTFMQDYRLDTTNSLNAAVRDTIASYGG